MTKHMIDSMQAIASGPAAAAASPFHYMPTSLNAQAIVGVLRSLNLQVPTAITAAAAKGESLRASDHRYSVKEVDAALKAANVPIGDRFRFKAALDRNGILGK
jgi:hypothetical protein